MVRNLDSRSQRTSSWRHKLTGRCGSRDQMLILSRRQFQKVGRIQAALRLHVYNVRRSRPLHGSTSVSTVVTRTNGTTEIGPPSASSEAGESGCKAQREHDEFIRMLEPPHLRSSIPRMIPDTSEEDVEKPFSQGHQSRFLKRRSALGAAGSRIGSH